MEFTEEEKEMIYRAITDLKPKTFYKKDSDILNSITEKITANLPTRIKIYLVGSNFQAKEKTKEAIDKLNRLCDRKIIRSSTTECVIEHVPTKFSMDHNLGSKYPIKEKFISMSGGTLDGLRADDVFILPETFTKLDDDKLQRALYLKQEIMSRNEKPSIKVEDVNLKVSVGKIKVEDLYKKNGIIDSAIELAKKRVEESIERELKKINENKRGIF